MKNKTPNITIVGGGMVGLSLALLLSKETSLNITLIEKFPLTANKKNLNQPSFDERSTAISASSAEILASIDCFNTIKENSEAIKTIHVSDRGHFGGTQLCATDYQQTAFGFVVENRHLGFALLDKLQQTSVECKTAVVEKAVPKKNGFSLHLNNDQGEEIVETDCLIVADGAQSNLRQQLGIEHTVKPYQQVAMIANVALENDHNGIAYERFTPNGPIALLPLPKHQNQHRAALVWTIAQDKLEAYQDKESSALIEQLHQEFGYRAGRIKSVGERYFYPLELVTANEQVRSNCIILGNAAHFLHPVAGQGFNLALRDCEQLSHIIIDAARHSDLPLGHYKNLKAYEARQEFDQQKTIVLTDQLVELFSSDKLSLSVIRQLGLLGLSASPFAKSLFTSVMMGQRYG